MALYNCYFITLLILHHADCMGHLDLLRNLFDPVRYDIDLHPFNYSDPLEVNMTTSLYQVLNLVSKIVRLTVKSIQKSCC